MIDFWTGCPEITAGNHSFISGEILNLLLVTFFLLVDISLLLPLLAFFSSCCKTIKRNYSKLQAILIKYDISGMT